MTGGQFNRGAGEPRVHFAWEDDVAGPLRHGVAEYQFPAVEHHRQAGEPYARKLPGQPLVGQVAFQLRACRVGRRRDSVRRHRLAAAQT